MTSHSDAATDNNLTAVADTVATVGDGVGNGAVATVTGAMCSDDATIATDGDQSKIVIPAGRRNPDARTASQIGARSLTATTVGDGTITPAGADGTYNPTMLLALPVLAYLIGSVSCAVVVCRLMGLPDPRASGSGNPGATNVLRVGGGGGTVAAALTLVGDAAKGCLPVLAADALGAGAVTIALTAAAAFAGHLYPAFFAFKGGKGVATAAGALAGWSVALGLSLLAVWLATAAVSRTSSLAALVAAAAAPALTWWLLAEPVYFLVSVGIAAMLCWRHRQNIRRLLDGSEGKF